MLLQAYTWVRVATGDLRSRMHERFVAMVGDETGATAAEYALLVTLIAIAIIVGARWLGSSVNTRLSDTGNEVAGV